MKLELKVKVQCGFLSTEFIHVNDSDTRPRITINAKEEIYMLNLNGTTGELTRMYPLNLKVIG